MKTAILKKELHEVFSVPPNDLYFAPVTRVYKIVTKRLKHMPFVYILPLSFFVAAAMYMLLGQLLVKLVSLLQYGS